MLEMPEYIHRLHMAGKPARHVWNDADPGSIHRQDGRLATLIGRTSHRGVVALSCGFGEWIAWRLHEQVDVTVLLSEIEAVWAGIIDWRYVSPLHDAVATPRKREWQGPLRGPVYSAFDLLGDVVWRARRLKYTAEAASCLSTLAIHVLPDPQPFLEWRGQMIKRLSSFYPFDVHNMPGPPVPRDALDPSVEFQPDRADELLARFLESLDYTRNPFLRSPGDMIADGFIGTPYRWRAVPDIASP